LYEGGYITYMRTDSITLASSAISAARAQVKQLYGQDYLPASPRMYTSKVKNAQEAHEAIRPAGDSFRTPAQTGLTGDRFRLYELIWMRTIASLMADAKCESVSILFDSRATASGELCDSCEFVASGRTITFSGLLRAYVESLDEGAGGQS